MWQGVPREVWMSKCRHCQRLTEFMTLAQKKDEIIICSSCMGMICQRCGWLRDLGKPCMVDEEQIRIEERIATRVATKDEIDRYLEATGRR